MVETIEGSGFPLGFLVGPGTRPSLLGAGAGKTVYVTEARMLSGHQKEAVVHEGEGGQRWRVTSDEGAHLRGADVSPFPLGFFNAGMQGDIMGRILALAAEKGIEIGDLAMFLQNYYWMTGSFAKGTGTGYADPPKVEVSGDADDLDGLVRAAAAASPAVATVATPTKATFALYVNGRREPVSSVEASHAADAPDPFVTYSSPPAPHADAPAYPIWKTGETVEGIAPVAASGTDTRIILTVSGRSVVTGGSVETDTWLEMNGASHFALRSDDRARGNVAPSGLSYFSAGVAFCYMTQLSRYIEHMKLDIGGMRLVQYSPYEVRQDGRAIAHPVDTHLFLNGRADTETHEMLLRVAATTCYLHATLAAELPPVIRAGAPVSA